MTSTITPLLEKFSESAVAVKDELRTYASCDPSGFLAECLPLVSNGTDAAARRFVLQLLLKYANIAEYLADPAQSSREQAIGVAKVALELGVPLGIALEHILAGIVKDKSAGPAIVRIIDVFSALAQGRYVLRFQKELLAHADPKVCSKTVLELVRAGKGPALVAQTLLDGDPRIQANAVEALWDIKDKNAKAVLQLAAKSRHNRVVANALMGLYRHGVVESIPQLLRMAEHPDLAHRNSAVWMMGETKDPRFLTFLTSQFTKSSGKERLGIVRALSRIRKQLRDAEAAGKLRMRLYEARIQPDGSRKLVVALCLPGGDLSALLPTQFSIWEDNELVTAYSTRCVPSPPLLILGFGILCFASQTDPYGEAVGRALAACVDMRRTTDPWRLERYLADEASRSAVKDQAELSSEDDQTPLSLHMKNHRGFVLDSELIHELIREPGQRDRAAPNFAAVISRLVDHTSRLSGPRHLFLFFAREEAGSTNFRQLAASLKNEPVTLHGFVASEGGNFAAMEELCAATHGGTFQAVPLEQLEQVVTDAYAGLMDRYELTYNVDPAKTSTRQCEVKVLTASGAGSLTCTLQPA